MIGTDRSSTVTPVYKDPSGDQAVVVSIDRWSLCRDGIALFWWFLDQSTVVTIDRWFLCRGAIVLL